MRSWLIAAAMLSSVPALRAETVESAYTDLDTAKTCSVFDFNTESGEFANFACNGYLGYPVLLYTGDLRESIFYGFPPAGDHHYESFSAFNSSGSRSNV